MTGGRFRGRWLRFRLSRRRVGPGEGVSAAAARGASSVNPSKWARTTPSAESTAQERR